MALAGQIGAKVARRVQLVSKARVRVEMKVLEGDPVSQIIRHARKTNADLIVLATTRLSGRRDLPTPDADN